MSALSSALGSKIFYFRNVVSPKTIKIVQQSKNCKVFLTAKWFYFSALLVCPSVPIETSLVCSTAYVSDSFNIDSFGKVNF